MPRGDPPRHTGEVVEDRCSAVFRLEHVRPAVVADGLAEVQVGSPSVPVVSCETRTPAQAWTLRFLVTAAAAADPEAEGEQRRAALAPARPLTPPESAPAEVRLWAREQGLAVSERGGCRSR